MNIIENLEQLDEIYGKSDGYVISLYKEVINTKILKNYLDKFEGLSEANILDLVYCKCYLVIDNDVKIIKSNELSNYLEKLDNKPLCLFGVNAVKYLINQMACEEIKKTLATIFVSEFNVTTKFSLEIYRSLIYRNLRLTKQYELNAPELIKINEQRLIQELVDELF
jgi:hypothetical protein